MVISQEVWFLMAADNDTMDSWMSSINTVIIDLFRNMYNVPEDNYWSQGWVGPLHTPGPQGFDGLVLISVPPKR